MPLEQQVEQGKRDSVMGVDVTAYVEKKNNETGKWELSTQEAVSARLKYILEDWDDMKKVDWDDLSDGLQKKYPKDENGLAYATFYVTTLDELESEVARRTTETFTRVNTIIKALGADRVYSDEGEETWGGGGDDSNKKDKLTFPVNKDLIEDLQFAFSDVRKIGQRETLDLFLSENIGYDGEYRIILAVS